MMNMADIPLPMLTRLKSDFEAEYRTAMLAQNKPPMQLWYSHGEYKDPYIQSQWTKYVDLAYEQARPLKGDAAMAAEAHAAEPRASKWDHLPDEVEAELKAAGRAAAPVDDDLISAYDNAPHNDAKESVADIIHQLTDRREDDSPLTDTAVLVELPSHIDVDLSVAMTLNANAAEEEQRRNKADRRRQRFVDTQSGDPDLDLAMLHSSVDDILSMEIDLLRAATEQYRRERPVFDAIPVVGVMDYGNAGTAISLAMHHLDESLPNGQKKRSEYALKLLTIGTEKLTAWMRAKGYDV